MGEIKGQPEPGCHQTEHQKLSEGPSLQNSSGNEGRVEQSCQMPWHGFPKIPLFTVQLKAPVGADGFPSLEIRLPVQSAQRCHQAGLDSPVRPDMIGLASHSRNVPAECIPTGRWYHLR